MTDLTGKVALVTGSSRGLGAVIARRLAGAGCDLAVNYNLSREPALALAAEIRSMGCRAEVYHADVAQSDQTRQMVERTADDLGGLDMLVNNAGPWTATPFRELVEAEWTTILDANVKGAWAASQAAYPHMRQRGWGRIVSICAGSLYVRNHSVYGLAKDALRHLTEALAVEFAPEVTVNAVAPGLIDSPDLRQTHADFAEERRRASPLQRLVTQEEVAEMVYLLSASSAFESVTGATIPMTAGLHLPTASVP